MHIDYPTLIVAAAGTVLADCAVFGSGFAILASPLVAWDRAVDGTAGDRCGFSHGLVRGMGGTIGAANDAEGAVFTVTLACAEACIPA